MESNPPTTADYAYESARSANAELMRLREVVECLAIIEYARMVNMAPHDLADLDRRAAALLPALRSMAERSLGGRRVIDELAVVERAR